MSVIESVRELGKEIQKDERFIRFAKARLESDNNTELQAMIGEFNVTRMELDRISAAEEQNEEKHKELNEQLREIISSVSIPAVAIGGITYDNICELKGSFVSGAAVVSAIFGAENIEESTALLKERVKTVVK